MPFSSRHYLPCCILGNSYSLPSLQASPGEAFAMPIGIRQWSLAWLFPCQTIHAHSGIHSLPTEICKSFHKLNAASLMVHYAQIWSCAKLLKYCIKLPSVYRCKVSFLNLECVCVHVYVHMCVLMCLCAES